MAGMIRNLAILGGIVVIAGAGAAAYVTMHTPGGDKPASQQAALPPAAMPPPAAPAQLDSLPPESSSSPSSSASSPSSSSGTTPPPALPAPSSDTPSQAALPDASAGGSASPQDVPTLEFSSLIQPFSLVRDSAAFVAANPDAPQMYPLKAGTSLVSAEKSRDGKWVIAMTADGQAAYLPAADLGPYNPSAAPKLDLAATVSGSAKVVDTATLTVDGQTVPLAGVAGRGDEYARQLQSLIDAQGPSVSCTLSDQAYVCKLPTGLDIARSALFNGAADLAPDASDDYRQQALAAKNAGRGIWRR